MAEAHLSLERHVRGLLGSTATVATDPSGLPRVAPHSEEALSLLMQAACKEGWRVRIDGTGQWMPTDAPADIAVTTQCFNDISYLNPADLVATAGAGMSWKTLQHHLADQGAWVALDPPGGTQRSVGSVVATGSAGPLRGCYGNVRDQVLGLTLVTGDGQVLRAGGIVVKNVAGFDLVKLATGSFGGFGIVISATFRLRSVPRANVTLLGTGTRDRLIEAAREILAAGLTPAALELLSPDVAGTPDWELAIRLVGSNAEVATTRDAVRGVTRVVLSDVAPHDAAELWNSILAGTARHPTTIRLGALPSSIDRALDLTNHHLGEGCTTASVGVGVIRWCGNATPEDLKRVRHTAAQQEIPLTLERAPWATRAAVGLFGAYREGGRHLVHGLRKVFDPAGIIVAPLESEP